MTKQQLIPQLQTFMQANHWLENKHPIMVQLSSQGSLTLPKTENYPWHHGDTFILVEFEDRFVLCPRSAFITVLKQLNIPETALLSESALAEDWQRPEEEAAWSHLQLAQLS